MALKHVALVDEKSGPHEAAFRILRKLQVQFQFEFKAAIERKPELKAMGPRFDGSHVYIAMVDQSPQIIDELVGEVWIQIDHSESISSQILEHEQEKFAQWKRKNISE